MAGAFTYDLTTEVGQVRLGLTDTREGGWFDDEEIAYFLSSGGSVKGAIVAGARVLLMDRARRSRSASASGESYDDRGQVQALEAIIKQYGGGGTSLPAATVTMPGLLPMDTGWSST